MPDEGTDQDNGPQFEVWNHLWSAIEQAADEFRSLEPDSRRAVERVGKLIADARVEFVLAASDRVGILLRIEEEALEDPWIRHAAEIEIATLGVDRADGGLKRFLRLRPLAVSQPVPETAKPYLREVIDTYVLGFDAACVALCRATCEQLLRDLLVKAKIYTPGRLRKERPTAGALFINAKRAGLLRSAARAADRLIRKGDTIMHDFIYDKRILEQQALDSINELAEVISELLGSGGLASA
jgi:hypothetical protein